MQIKLKKLSSVLANLQLAKDSANYALPVGLLLASLMNVSQAAEDNSTAQANAKKEKVAEEKKVVSASDEQLMQQVNVSGVQEIAKEDGYQATKTRVGKMLQDPHDIPQAVTTVTKALMHDQQVGSLREALRNVSGLTFNAAEGGRAGDNFMLRGFYTFGDTYLDGIRDTAQYNRETFYLEQVDVLRGSAAMLFGRGQAGGVINQVSKTAHLGDKNVVTGSLGEYDYHQVTGDFNKQITETSAIRVNVMDRYEETYRKNDANGDRPAFDREGIAISFGAGIGTDNEFFLNHVYTQTHDVPDFGVRFDAITKRPIDNGVVDNKTFFGTDNNFDDSDTRITTASFSHHFSKDTEWRTQIRHGDYERAYWAKTPAIIAPSSNGSVGGNVTRTMDYETLGLQTDVNTKFELAGMKHQFMGGLEYLKEDSYRNSLAPINPLTGQVYTQTGAALNTAIAANGVIFKRGIESRTAIPVSFDADNYALFIQDSIEFIPKWDLLLGVRRDELKANYSSLTSPKLEYGENSYRTGLSYHYSPDVHYYVSYSDAFSPTADLYQQTVSPLPPERSETIEIGSKWLFLDGDLAFRTALYSSTKDWERNTDLESTAAILTKKRRTNGLEFELSGNITDDWEAFAGIALMDAKIIKAAENVNATTGAITLADERFEGQRARNTPRATFNLWTTYKLQQHWKIGGGIEAKGERFGYVPSQTVAQTSTSTGVFADGSFNPNTLPGYARVDAMVEYEQAKWAVRLNVKNLLDKEYYDAIYDNGGFSVPGNRRQAIITTEYRF